ncbi:U3 small nucleolar RNA-associated protein 4 homolog [Clavelina lepadiformis]
MSKFVVHRCRLFKFTPCAVQCMAASVETSDLAVARSDGSIEIWSTKYSWFQKLVIPGSSDHSVESLIWVGNRLLSGGLQGDITEYDLTDATVKLSVDSFGGAVWCIAYSIVKDKIAVGCEDGSVKMFDVKNKAITFERAFDKQEGRILSMAWHKSGDIIVTGSTDVVRIWSTKTGHAIQRITIEREMKNVETIIWSVAILSDYTIISGDSSGRVQFWNGKNATLLQSHRAHRADVLCLCSTKDEKCVYAAGVDPRVIAFNLVQEDDVPTWVKGRYMQKHTHDVRALAIIENRIVSGGVDTNLMMNSISEKVGSFQRVYSFPMKSLVSTSATKKLVLMQYSNYLDLWKFAKCNFPEELNAGRNIPIEDNPVKLLQIKPPSSDTNHICCSVISPCGNWIAYSTTSTLRLYNLQTSDELSCKVIRVRCVGLIPSHCIVFTPDSNYMITSTTNHKILIVHLVADTCEARLVQMLQLKTYTCITHLLAVSSTSSYLATANLDGEINVFDLTNMTHFCTLPKYQHTPSSIAFHPVTNDLMTAYDDLQVIEYSLIDKAYTKWTKQCLSTNNEPLLQTLRKGASSNSCNIAVVTSIRYVHSDEVDKVFFMSREGLYIAERVPNHMQDTKSHLGARFCHKFKPLLCTEFIDESTLFVVERPLQDIWEQLPPTLYQKKFGT